METASRTRSGRTRNYTSVVWKLCDHQVVGFVVAERGNGDFVFLYNRSFGKSRQQLRNVFQVFRPKL